MLWANAYLRLGRSPSPHQPTSNKLSDIGKHTAPTSFSCPIGQMIMNNSAHPPFVNIQNALIAHENDLQSSYVGKLLQRLGVADIHGAADSAQLLERLRTAPIDLVVTSARLQGSSALQLIDILADSRYGGHVIVGGVTDMRIQSAIYEYAQQRDGGRMQLVFAGEPLRLFDFTDMLYRAATPATVDTSGQLIENPAKRINASDVYAAYLAGEISAFMQPIYCLATGSMVGAEALVRWQHPTLGVLGPDCFLSLLEECDLGQELLDQLVDTVASVGSALTMPIPLKLSINVSANQLVSASWADGIVQRLIHSGGNTSHFAIEVTEDGIANRDGNIAGAVAHWRLNGIDCAIDDFGTGASSINRLCMAPFNILKIDRQMVWRSRLTSHVFETLEGIVRLAHGLGMRVIAEGIETEEDLLRMRSIKCDIGQGYHFSRPLPVPEFLALASSHNVFGRRIQRSHLATL
ncbi:EAL domain-containing protein (putative c-di-GMP-specific phosphodiesterase class I) [Xanthomonas sacchari]|uniref:EAL domain-containing response regulator n=1 Tax=Xanthomonas sacchari TaxID=56458 RepID=UPI00277EB2E1|nr:EAL domain-containing protein [Xanthomonas sacchari]MDQ1093591.1 EAL domain-containing protein (putative c-di-GMP-specific phosphodiesterase class I) [Xanthomonas sacchari]